MAFAGSPGDPDYGIPQMLLVLALVSGAAAGVHLAYAWSGVRSPDRPPTRGGAALGAALACPALVVAAVLSGQVSVDWPVLLLAYAATFVPHVLTMITGARSRRRGTPTAAR
jgi:hypothetical protein